ncbi:MAG: NADP-dependent malic enzyme, partial [Myxococcales bacterium]|nr:NADP-dependent malic enzyme [Myxococcales bacterium]
GIAKPILIGRPETIARRIQDLGLSAEGIEFIDRDEMPHQDRYAEELWALRGRRGVTRVEAHKMMRHSRTCYGLMMVRTGDADGMLAGITASYAETIRPALQIVGVREGVEHAAGLYMVIGKQGATFFADTSINIDPDAETVAEIAVLSADLVRALGIVPRVAMLSFSNFGDAPHPESRKMARATALVKQQRPDLIVDGEMQLDVAMRESAREPYPFCSLEGTANVLIFPNLSAGNIAYKLLTVTEGVDVIGPLVLGMNRPVNVLQQGVSVSNIVHLAAITAAHPGS